MILNEICKLPDKDNWLHTFLQSKTYQSILTESKKLHVTIPMFNDQKLNESDINITPRHADLAGGQIDLHPFYILDYISSNTKETIFDIGCGCNFFKNYYNIVGIDPYSPYADRQEYFDDEFIIRHASTMSNAISICAIHFCTVAQLKNRLQGFFNLVKKNGYAYLAINAQRILDQTYNKINQIQNDNFKSLIEKKYFPNYDIENLFNTTLFEITNDLNLEVLLYQNTCRLELDSSINGNIKILVKR